MASGDGREPTGHRAYIGSFTSAGGRGVTSARFDPATGRLDLLHHTETAVPDPSYLTVHGGLLYAVSETESGAAAAFSLADPDRPALLSPPVPVRGSAPTHVSVAGGHLCTANYGSGSVSVLPVRADGTLGGQASLHQHRGRGPDPERQEGPHAHSVSPDPSGRWLLCADLGTDSVWIYDTGAGPAMTRHREVPMRPGSGPRHVAFHPDGEHLYVVNELDSTVTACRWDGREGVLEPLETASTLPEGADPRGNYPSEIVLSGDGRLAWVANRGHDSIVVLTLPSPAHETSGEGGGGRMELTSSVPCGGHWPRDLALHPSGRWLYAANERSGDVTCFGVDPATGVPYRLSSVSAPAASCVTFSPDPGGSAGTSA